MADRPIGGPPDEEHVRLLLGASPDSNQHSVFLELPLWIIRANSVNQFKYLQFCATYITGVPEGHLSMVEDGPEPPVDTSVSGGQTWWWVLPLGKEPFGYQAICLAAGRKPCPSTQMTTTTVRKWMEEELATRERNCPFTGCRKGMCQPLHIVPHDGGDEWLEQIFSYREWDADSSRKVRQPSSFGIDEPRNAILVNCMIKRIFELGEIGILATPNVVLNCADVPPREAREGPRRHPAEGMDYPSGVRYTLQWLVRLEEEDLQLGGYPRHNLDAAFNIDSPGDEYDTPELPDSSLLNYAYACNLVFRFGKTASVFSEREHMVPRPPAPAPTPADLEREEAKRYKHDPRYRLFNDEGELCLGEHPEGYGRLGEDGRITAEDFMYLMALEASGRQEKRQREEQDDWIQTWRESVHGA